MRMKNGKQKITTGFRSEKVDSSTDGYKSKYKIGLTSF